VTFWALVPRWAKLACLGAILAAGGAFWLYRRGFTAGRATEHLAATEAATKAAQTERAARGQAVADAYERGRRSERVLAGLRDSVRVVDSVTVLITLPGLAVSTGSLNRNPVAVTLPAIVVRRIVADSVALSDAQHTIATQAALLKADTAAIASLEDENRTLRDMKAPVCRGKCRVAAYATAAVVAGEVVVRVVRALKPRR
jgi:hypothetical protein